jgi:CHAT domain-containing protein/tetratricopeptide (TPR) repeat protein
VTTVTQGTDSARQKRLLTKLLRLKDKTEQARFLANRRELLSPDVVAWLTDSVREQAKVDVSRAIRLAELGLMIARKLGDRDAVAQSFRAMGNALYLSGKNRAAVKSHEKAHKIFVALGNATQAARTLSASIQPLILTGQYDRAFSAAEQARRIFAAQGDDWRLARVELNAGNILHRQDRFAEALEHYQRAHRYFLAKQEKDPEGMAVALHNVAMCLVSLNDFPRALATYQDARQFALRHGMDVLVGQADYNIALLHYFRGEYSRAIDILRGSLDTFRRAKDRYHVALCCLDLSEIYLEVNRDKQAEEMAQHAVQDFQKLEMGYEEGKSLANLAFALWQQGKTTTALELFVQCRKMLLKEENRIWPSRIDLYQAVIFIEQNRYTEARRLCLAALKVFQTSKVPRNVILCRLLLAQICLRTGQLDSARLNCATALKHLRTLEAPDLSCQTHHLLGQIHAEAAHWRDAYYCYQNACQILEVLRSGLNREELKISFMKNRLEIYEGLVELCLKRTSDQPSVEEAFEYIEQSKSRSLRDLMFKAGSEFHLAPNLDAELQHKVQELRAEIHWYSHTYETEQLRGTKRSPERLSQIQVEIRKRETELLNLVREIPVSMAESSGLVSPKPVSVEEMRSTMPPDSMLLEFFQIRDRFVAVLLNCDLLEIVPVAAVSRVIDLLVRLQFQLSKFRLAPEYNSTFGEALLHSTQCHLKELHDELIGPVRSHLSGSHLLIVPHGILHSLPFHALFDGQQYLIDTFSISYAPSATIFSLCHVRSANRSDTALVLGVPDVAAPFVLDESRAVAARIPASELFLGEAATASVLREKGKKCGVIHIATHGYFRQDHPMFSGIRLGDGILSLYDLYQLKLPAQLITLSGCSTGLSALADGDELLGLARGLIYAGAQAALLTLWDVQDRSTAQFMTTFYSQLSNGENKAAAVRQAALELRVTYPHPYYWAPFVLLGKTAPN